MFRKLLKYELRAVMRIMAIVWIGMLSMSLLYGMGIRIFIKGSFQSEIINGIAVFLGSVIYSMAYTALIVITAVIIVVRFYKGMLRDEAYLTHTLPVRVGEVILAKALVAFMMTIVGVLVSILSIIIMGGLSGGFLSGIEEIFLGMGWQSSGQAVLLLGLCLLAIMAMFSAKIYKVYFSMSLGQLSNRHKILMSVVAYVTMGFIMAALSYAAAIVVYVLRPIRYAVESFIYGCGDTIVVAYISIGIVLTVNLGLTIGFHFLTEYVLRNKLNLE